MSYQRLFINVMADYILLGHWHSKTICHNIYTMLQAQPAWVVPLIDNVLSHFSQNPQTTTKNQLINYISHNQLFIQAWGKNRQDHHIYQYNTTPPPNPPAQLNCDIPAINDIKQLALWLGISLKQLHSYTAQWRLAHDADQQAFHHYHYHWVEKRNGLRLIEAPKLRLAAIQNQIYLAILQYIPLHDACHGFRKQHSCKTYVAPHAGKKVILHMDLSDFFTRITLPRIRAVFTTTGYSQSVATCLARLCCNRVPPNIIQQNTQLSWLESKQLMLPHLPQGSPSSPALANIAAFKLDLRLTALSRTWGGDYTRYADDLAFSGNTDFKAITRNLPAFVAYIAMSEGFSVNYRKTRIMQQSVSQHLTGMTVNNFPNYPRKEYDQLKAILFNCVKFGAASQNRENRANFKSHIQGKIAFVSSLNPAKAAKLSRMFNQISWDD